MTNGLVQHIIVEESTSIQWVKIELSPLLTGAAVAQFVKCWPTDLVDRVRSLLETKSSQP